MKFNSLAKVFKDTINDENVGEQKTESPLKTMKRGRVNKTWLFFILEPQNTITVNLKHWQFDLPAMVGVVASIIIHTHTDPTNPEFRPPTLLLLPQNREWMTNIILTYGKCISVLSLAPQKDSIMSRNARHRLDCSLSRQQQF